jgi:hypothetical protein
VLPIIIIIISCAKYIPGTLSRYWQYSTEQVTLDLALEDKGGQTYTTRPADRR